MSRVFGGSDYSKWERRALQGKEGHCDWAREIWNELLWERRVGDVLEIDAAGRDERPYHYALRGVITIGNRLLFLERNMPVDPFGKTRRTIKSVTADCHKADAGQDVVSIPGNPASFRVRKSDIAWLSEEKVDRVALTPIALRNWYFHTQRNHREAYQEMFGELAFTDERAEHAPAHFARNYALIVTNNKAMLAYYVGQEGEYGRRLVQLLCYMMGWDAGRLGLKSMW